MIDLSYEDAFKRVKTRVEASRSSFRAGMAILPRDRREGMYALYGFCRVVDDIADESSSPLIATRELQAWRARIAEVFKGRPSDEITTALLPAIQKFKLLEKDFQEIIDGMEMDSIVIVAPEMARLDLYCDRVASAVGRVSVRIFGDAGKEAMDVAHHLGRAFQLTNILRDLAEDARRGRLYLPRELLEKHSIATKVPNEILKAPQLSAVCRDLAEVARDHYKQADALMAGRPRKVLRPALIMRTYYGAIFDLLIKEDWRDFTHRVSLPKWKKILLLFKGFIS